MASHIDFWPPALSYLRLATRGLPRSVWAVRVYCLRGLYIWALWATCVTLAPLTSDAKWVKNGLYGLYGLYTGIMRDPGAPHLGREVQLRRQVVQGRHLPPQHVHGRDDHPGLLLCKRHLRPRPAAAAASAASGGGAVAGVGDDGLGGEGSDA